MIWDPEEGGKAPCPESQQWSKLSYIVLPSPDETIYPTGVDRRGTQSCTMPTTQYLSNGCFSHLPSCTSICSFCGTIFEMSSHVFPHKQISPTSQASTFIYPSVSLLGRHQLMPTGSRKKILDSDLQKVILFALSGWWQMLNSYGSWWVTLLASKAWSLKQRDLLRETLFLSQPICEEIHPSVHWEKQKQKKQISKHSSFSLDSGDDSVKWELARCC